MKKKYIIPQTEIIVITQHSGMLAASGTSSTSRYATVGANGNAFKDDFNGGAVSVVGDVEFGGPSSSSKKGVFVDSFTDSFE